MNPRPRRMLSLFLVFLIMGLWAAPVTRAQSVVAPLTADLDGRPIDLVSVANYHCHDLDFPQIRCFRSEAALQAAVGPTLAATAISYVQIYENTAYGGGAMIVSEDYTVLALIGWNDRISSFKAVNSQAGSFYEDWFYGGSRYSFCCNQNVPGLGAYNDTFSSVKRA